MKTSAYTKLFLTIIIILLSLTGCEKLLVEKSDQKLAIPSTIEDFQALMDSWSVLNSREPTSLEVSADDYSLSDVDLAALTSEQYRRMYSWEKDNLFAPASNDWLYIYNAIYHCSSVIEGLDNSKINRSAAFHDIKGQALVFRSKFIMQALSVWSKAYSSSAGTDLGVPLRQIPNFNEPTVRATVKEGYDKVVADLKAAVPLLPEKSLHPYRPSKAAAYGMLARVLLYMGDYQEAAKYADAALKINNQLLDYNKLNAADRYPFALFNIEVVFDTYSPASAPINASRAKIEPQLIQSYHPNDLRKTVFFLQNGNFFYFKGTYHQPALFFGIATDELYLTLAECLIRTDKVDEGLSALNKLLINRFKAGTFAPLVNLDKNIALGIVLSERRKELVMRGLRWMDLKRLNVYGANITISRTINGQAILLKPNDNRYALPIPEDVIQITGIPQNDR